MARTAVVSIHKFELVPIWFLRIIAVCFLLLSLFGTYVQFNGGWERAYMMDDTAAFAFVYALVFQIVCFLVQLGSKSNGGKWWIAYFVCLAVSFYPSVSSFGPYLFAALVDIAPAPLAYLCAGAILIGIDVIPEWVLTE